MDPNGKEKKLGRLLLIKPGSRLMHLSGAYTLEALGEDGISYNENIRREERSEEE